MRQLQLPSLEDPPTPKPPPRGIGTIGFLKRIKPYMLAMVPTEAGWTIVLEIFGKVLTAEGKIPFYATRNAYVLTQQELGVRT